MGAYCCKICELFFPILDNCQINSYVAGMTLGTHPSRKLFKHEISKVHVRANQRYINLNSTSSSSKVMEMLNKASKKRHEIEVSTNQKYVAALIKTIYFVLRQCWALGSIDKFLEFLEGLGTPDVVEFIKLHPKLRYTSYRSLQKYSCPLTPV